MDKPSFDIPPTKILGDGVEVIDDAHESNLEDFIPRYYKIRRAFFLGLFGFFHAFHQVVWFIFVYLVEYPFEIVSQWASGPYREYGKVFVKDRKPCIGLGNRLFSGRRIYKKVDSGFRHRGMYQDERGHVMFDKAEQAKPPISREELASLEVKPLTKVSGESEWTPNDR